MATTDVPGYNPTNNDKLSRGSWAEHDDGSLIFVKDIDENDRVIFDLYDLANLQHPIFYPNALALYEFEKTFSYEPKKKKKVNLKWTWHDKTEFPWERVMRVIQSPLPVATNVQDTLTAAAQMAQSLNFRLSEVLTQDHILKEQGLVTRPQTHQSRTILQRLKNALGALVD